MEDFVEDSRKRLVSMTRHRDSTKVNKKEDFTRSVREDREKRALEKRKEKSAILIQKCTRSYLTRIRMRSLFYQEFLQKITDLKKLQVIFGSKQPRFASRASSIKLIRYCLFTGEYDNPDIIQGLKLVLSVMQKLKQQENQEEEVFLHRFRLAYILKFYLNSKWITMDDVTNLVQNEGDDITDFVLSFPSIEATIRAVKDLKFTLFATRSLQLSGKLGLRNNIGRAFVLASILQPEQTGRLFSQITPPIVRELLYEYLLVHDNDEKKKEEGRHHPLYASPFRFPINNWENEKSDEIFTSLGLSFSFEQSSEEINNNNQRSYRLFAQIIGKFVNSKTKVETLSIICNPKNVSMLISSNKLSNNNQYEAEEVNALFSICSFFNQVLERFSSQATSNGLSIRSQIILGAITPMESPPIVSVWDALLRITSYSSDSEKEKMILLQVISFACVSSSLLFDSLDDEELFSQRSPVSIKMLQAIVLLLKDIMYDFLWLRSTKPPENIIDFFSRVYDRCSRHGELFDLKKIFLFPSIPPIELGLSSTISSTANRPMTSLGGEQEEEEEEEEDTSMNLLTSATIRGQQILKTVPMVIPFEQRVSLFHRHLQKHKSEQTSGEQPFWNEATQQIEVPNRLSAKLRRDHVVQDAYEQLGNVELTRKIQITFVSDLGLEEAGVGPGPFKEFITLFCQQAFDPKFNLFQRNLETGQLYPTPQQANLKLLEFVGKMIGRAIYDNILVEPELAPFVLNIVRGTKNVVHDLQSLDASLYRNLVSLKSMSDAELESLGATFTIFAYNTEIPLVPNGRNISVTKENRLAFIERVADFRLNRELLTQIEAFSRGFQCLIDSSWIRLFSAQEFAMLIGGTARDVDVNDLRLHVQYSGGYLASQPYIHDFWSIFQNDLTPEQRSKFLRFVTSCSRPPLTGFGSLEPNITIYQVRDETRLPTSSTCVNLLKLPKYSDRETLKQKLIFAIESGSGFELS